MPLPAAVGEGDVAVAEEVPQAVRPISAHVSPAAIIHGFLPFGSTDIALATGRAEMVSRRLAGSWSFMMAFLLLRQLSRAWR
jgi:hypothetical protein